MRTMKIAALGLTFGLLAAGCAGTGERSATPQANVAPANVTGTWEGTFISPSRGSVPVVLTVEQNGTNVTGKLDDMSSGYGGNIQGVVKGNDLSWKVLSGSGGGELAVKGNEITGTARDAYGTARMVLRRRQ